VLDWFLRSLQAISGAIESVSGATDFGSASYAFTTLVAYVVWQVGVLDYQFCAVTLNYASYA
jgi:hypothetical protein